MRKIATFIFILLPLFATGQNDNLCFKTNEKLDILNESKSTTKFYKFTIDDFNELLDEVTLDDNGLLTFDKVVQSLDNSKSELYDIAISFISEIFTNPKNVIQVQDKEAGILSLRAVVNGSYLAKDAIMTYSGSEPLFFTIKMEFRENRYRIQVFGLITEKGDLLDESANIETFLNSTFFDKSINKGPLRYRTTAHYINLRTQLVYSQINAVCSLIADLENHIKNYKSTENW